MRLLATLVDLHARTCRLDIAAHAAPRSHDQLRRTIAPALVGLLSEAIEVLGELESAYESGAGTGSDELDWGDTFELTPLISECPGPPRRSMEVTLTQHVADTCFTASSELRRILRQLGKRDLSHDELLDVCERARRKLRRALAVVDDAAARADGQPSAISADRDLELETGIAIRAMYAKFRRSLIRCDESDPASVKRAIRYAAVSLAVMIGCGDFSDVRMADRRMLLALQQRVLAWARGGRPADGARLFKDIETTAELLSGINLRQELQTHDAELIASLRPRLRAGEVPNAERDALVGALRQLRGRSDRLDDLIEHALATGLVPAVADRIAVELDSIAADLPGHRGTVRAESLDHSNR